LHREVPLRKGLFLVSGRDPASPGDEAGDTGEVPIETIEDIIG